jgi:TonB-dependent SusC/RagA subfamily outer membrane receptor
MQSLQGSVPGVQIGQVNQAGEEPNIQIRGQTSIDGNQDPLIVLDGIIYRGRIGDINPADIKSVDILKDASSQAIYGAQAGNGVILITTKGGKSGRKPTINYSGSFSTQTPSNDARLLNREEVLQKVRDVMYRDSYLAPDYTEPNPAWDFSQSELLPALLTGIDNGNDYDWWGALT